MPFKLGDLIITHVINMHVLLFGFFLTFVAGVKAQVDLDFGNSIMAQLDVASVTMADAGMVITYEGMMGKYGLVHATQNREASNDPETKGHFTGAVQSINDEGVTSRAITVGLWQRDGSQLRIYGFDDDDAARILWIGDVNLRKKSFAVKVWELDN